MKSIKELEGELAAAKAAQLVTKKEELVKPFVDQIAGRCFLYRDPSKRCNITGFVKYGKTVKFDTNEHQGDHVDIDEDRVYAQSVPGFWYVGNVVQAKKETGVCHKYLHDTIKWHTKEVSLAAFMAAWESVGVLASSMQTRWAAAHDVPELVVYSEPKKGELDAPFITLEPGEGWLVGEPVFRIGNQYLITPNSVRFALDKLDENEAIEARCSHLYEACDMAYVTRKRACMDSLRAKLRVAEANNPEALK